MNERDTASRSRPDDPDTPDDERPDAPPSPPRSGRSVWVGEPMFAVVLAIAAIWILMTLSIIGFNAPVAPGSAEASQLARTVRALDLHRQTPPGDRPWPPAMPTEFRDDLGLGFVAESDFVFGSGSGLGSGSGSASIDSPSQARGSNTASATRTPAITWLQMAIAPPAIAGRVDADQLTRRCRMASAALLFLTFAGVGWTGFCLGRLAPGGAAVLVVAACPWMLVSGVVADGTILIAALTSAAIACAVWGMRPLRSAPPRVRQLLGFATCGILAGGQALAGGPEAMLLIVGPLLVLGATCPRRNGHLLGSLAAIGLAALVIMAWVATLAQHNVDAAHRYLNDWEPQIAAGFGRALDTFFSHGQLWLLAWLPWTFWLFAAFLQPFSTSSRDSYHRLLAGWGTMLITVIAVAAIEREPTARHLMVLSVPGVGLALGQVFARYIELSAEGRHARLWRLLKWPHVALVLAGSLMVGLTMAQPSLPNGQITQHPALLGELTRRGQWLEPTPTATAFASGALLLLIALLMVRFTLRQYPGRALAAYTAWWMATATVLAGPVSSAPAIEAPNGLDRISNVLNTSWDGPLYRMPGTSIEPLLVLMAGRDIPEWPESGKLSKDARVIVRVDAVTADPVPGGLIPLDTDSTGPWAIYRPWSGDPMSTVVRPAADPAPNPD